jgi:hypothetical protein
MAEISFRRVVGVLLALPVGIVVGGFGTSASAAAGPDVAIAAPTGQQFIGTPALFDSTVSNTGTGPLTNVTIVSATVIMLSSVGAPTVLVGNDDSVLDPGEQWRYSVVGKYFLTDNVAVTVTGTLPDASTTAATAVADVEVTWRAPPRS